ncbi:MAG TPA: asparagine synthase (glutamine-hydrolyzing) [Actinomycetota bacterium]|nr:asparagine synthase (glutamine-hydrolyzing) [Actinomycetota bacterium]
MCGVAGFWGSPDRGLLEAMARVQAHRGPDDEGFFETEHASLGFRRLSIIDLPHGAQPMGNEDGRVQVVFNGEVYNFRELRAELRSAGHTFKTDSDTEAIVHAYEEWGLECFRRFNGMWAVAILDLRAEPKLVLCRDHFGIKPLHWARAGERILFASEIKAILQDEALKPQPNEQLLYEYLIWGLHDHTGGTFFDGVNQVRPATYIEIDANGVREQTYWTPSLSTNEEPDPIEFRRLFERSVERRLVADVPVGTCLSGGLDSSSIVSTMSKLLTDRVPDSVSLGERLKTFSAVFDGDPIDEREYIETELHATGAEKNYVNPTSEVFFEEIEQFVWHTEEPIVSTGPYAQWCVMRLAADKVKVLLDGQAGDELLAGYVPYHYVYLKQLIRERRYPTFAREAWAARDVLKPLIKRRLSQRRKAFDERTLLRPGYLRSRKAPNDTRPQANLKKRLLEDLTTYSLPSLLRYEDRNSMAHSIESRIPFLDQEMVEWVFRLPESAIIRDGWSRWILRQGLRDALPEKIRTRRWKVGFTTPEMRWLRARRAIIQSLFRSPAFCARPYWNGLDVADAFRRACDGEIDDSMFFWRAINVELWLRVYLGDRTGRELRKDTVPSFAHYGDELAARALDDEAARLLAAHHPNPGRHLFVRAADDTYARVPVRTPVISAGDDLQTIVEKALVGHDVRDGDTIAISEKAVAVSQGRSFPIAEVRPTTLAKLLARFVGKTPVGIGLGMPQTMQLAIEEVGAARILFAALVAAVTRPFGIRGIFYRIAGPQAAAIDGPTPGTLPPYNTHAKKAPADPDGVARALSKALGAAAAGAVGVAIVDANDIGVNVLGASAGVDRSLVVELFRDNPLGQGHQQTPIALIRRMAPR